MKQDAVTFLIHYATHPYLTGSRHEIDEKRQFGLVLK
jgi:hypothetical protein